MATKKVTTTTKISKPKVVKSKVTKTPKVNVSTTSILDPRIFAATISERLIAQVVHIYQSRSHQGTHQAKTRGEVNRTTKKVYKQKGTGNARHGARSAPIYVGGGVSHGPTGERPANLKVNRKMAASALIGLLSQKAKENKVNLFEVPNIAKPTVKAVKGLFPYEGTLIIHASESPLLVKSTRNLENVTTIESARLNPLLVIQNKNLLITSKAQEQLITRLLPLLKK